MNVSEYISSICLTTHPHQRLSPPPPHASLLAGRKQTPDAFLWYCLVFEYKYMNFSVAPHPPTPHLSLSAYCC